MPAVNNIGVDDIWIVASNESITKFKNNAIQDPIKAMNKLATIPAIATFTIHL